MTQQTRSRTAKNNLDHVVTLKYMNPLLYKEIHFQTVKYIINGQSTNINVFSWLLFFFKLRETVVYKIWVYRRNSPKVTYLIFQRGSTGESFFFHGLIDFILFFYTGLKNLGSLLSQIFFCLQPGILAKVRLPATNPAKQLPFLFSIFADGKESLLPF